MEKTEKKSSKFFNAIKIISNIIFIPIIIIVLFASIIMFSAKRNSEVPSLFGYSVVKILSSSMSKDITTGEEQPQFAKGQFVVVKLVDTKTLKEGDIIAFYKYRPDLDPNKSELPEVSESKTPIVGGARNDLQKRVAPYSKVIFHKIVAISTPSDTENEFYGKQFFQTKGDANASADADWIMEDFVVGKYESSNSFICGLFQFCSSTAGSITLIIVPSIIVIAMLATTIFKQAKDIKFENAEEEDNAVFDKPLDDESDKSEKEKDKQSKEQKEQILKNILSDAEKQKSGLKNKDIEQKSESIKDTKPTMLKVDDKKVSSIEKKVEQTQAKVVEPKKEQTKVEPPKAKVPPKAQPKAPIKSEPQIIKQEPKVEQKVAPTKVPPKAPAKIPPKAPPKKQ